MDFVESCIADSMPIWEECLRTPFLTQLEQGTLDEACLKGYMIDDSLYLWQYAKVFAWGILHSGDPEAMRTFYSFLSFVNEGEGSTRLQYLRRYGLTDQDVLKLPQRPQNKAYTDYMLEASREGAAQCMMAGLPCTLSYGWIFTQILNRTPSVRDTVFWPMVKDYTGPSYEEISRYWTAFGNKITEGLSSRELDRCREIFRTCSQLELGFWQMSETPRTDVK